MNTPFPLIRRHIYEEIETANTWQFFLYNNRSRVLLQYSCHKSCYTQGKANFWQKVADLYSVLAQEKTAKQQLAALTNDRRKESKQSKVAALEADFESVFAAIDAAQYELHTDLAVQSNSDFLEKIERVFITV